MSRDVLVISRLFYSLIHKAARFFIHSKSVIERVDQSIVE